MQAHIPQDYGTVAEIQELMGVNKMIIAPQASRPIMGVIQDCLLGAYLMTHKDTIIPKHQFMDCIFSAGEEYVVNYSSFLERVKKHIPNCKNIYTGRILFSILLPSDFQYSVKNDACKEEPMVIIKDGILISGIVDKTIIGRTQLSIISKLYKEYDCDRAADFLSSVQFLINRWLSYRGFSVGMKDFIISQENERGVKTAIEKAYLEVDNIIASNDTPDIKEFNINSALNNRGQSLAINGLCPNNRLETMIRSGSKGNQMNIIQITGHLGQNNVEGARIVKELDDRTRTLPCFERGDEHPRTRGFIESCFLRGLSPSEFWFHAKAGREGMIHTAVKTRDSGYTQRKLVKRMDDLIVCRDYTIRNSVNNVVSFSYGDSLDPTMIVNGKNTPNYVDIDRAVEFLNAQ